MDSDDYVYPNYIQSLVAGIGYTDLCISGIRFDRSGATFAPWVKDIRTINLTCEDDVKLMNPQFRDLFMQSACAKLYKSIIVKGNGLWFDPSMSVSEDFLFFLRYLGLINSFTFIPYTGYLYREPQSVQSRYQLDFKQYSYQITNFTKVIDELSTTHQCSFMQAREFVMHNQIGLFYYHLLFVPFKTFLTEVGSFKKAGYKWISNSRKKDIYIFLLRYAPPLAYLANFLIRTHL